MLIKGDIIVESEGSTDPGLAHRVTISGLGGSSEGQ
jgi:hypothetical protein